MIGERGGGEGEGERIKGGNDGGGCAVERADRPSGAVEDGPPDACSSRIVL